MPFSIAGLTMVADSLVQSQLLEILSNSQRTQALRSVRVCQFLRQLTVTGLQALKVSLAFLLCLNLERQSMHSQQNPSFAVPFHYVLFLEDLSLSEMDHDESRSFTRASLSNFAEALISPTVKCFPKSNLKLFSADRAVR